jgi:hypothetical protein
MSATRTFKKLLTRSGFCGGSRNDARLVVCGSAADVDDDPAVRERDDRRLAGENDLAAEDVAVETAGAFDVLDDDEMRERDSVVLGAAAGWRSRLRR